METAISLIADAQLHRTSAETPGLMKQSIKHWTSEVLNADQVVESYFVEVDPKSILLAE